LANSNLSFIHLGGMMKRNILGVLIALIFVVTSCTSNKKIEPDDEFAVEANTGSQDASLDKDLSLDGPAESSGANATDSSKTTPADSNQDLALENELSSLDNNTPNPAPKEATVGDELSLDEPAAQAPVVAAPVEPVVPPLQEPVVAPAPVVVEEPIMAQPVADVPVINEAPATIDSVSYKANQNGGTVEITSNRPLKYTTRLNKDTNQLMVEVENSVLPKKLKRSLNTKDMASPIGSVDMYQKAGSNISRFVVQLRPGAVEPLVQPEGNAILIVGGMPAGQAMANSTNNGSEQDMQNSSIDGQTMLSRPNTEITDLNSPGIMSSDDLEDFLISNNKFYGKKISIETNGMDLKEALRFLGEEGGINMILDDGVDGKVSLKLRNVPWDQAFILILKSKKLAFKRQGNVIRVARLDDIKRDEDEAIARLEARKSKVPFIVKRFFIGYADITELEKKISQFLTTAQEAATATLPNGQPAPPVKEILGKVLSDKRTNSLIVTDTEDNMVKIEKLIRALDTQPMQVLIEGKVVEAKEEFTRGLGIFWSSVPPSTSSNVKVGIKPALDAGFNVLDSTVTWGSLDILGSLTAQLQLGERTDKVKVLSSPRISVLSNEKATISQTAGILIPTVTNSVGSGTSGTTSTTSFTVAQVGVTLDVTPQVSNEGTVKMDLNIQRSFLARVDSQAPDVRNATTKVIVKSGQTAVIGGIFESEVRNGQSGVPGLQDVPIIGRLFKGDRDAKSKNELVIFVTPNILKPVLGSEKRSDGELQ
jgi:type IV pilus assembly protein PilQ